MTPTSPPTVVVAEGEAPVLQSLHVALSNAAFSVVTATTGSAALGAIERMKPSMALLDLSLFGMSGLELCRALKEAKETSQMAIITLSAKNREHERLLALEYGMDDCILKPYSVRELVLRVKAILRFRFRPLSQRSAWSLGDIFQDYERRMVLVKGREIRLTPAEFRLLEVLIENAERVLSRDRLQAEVWKHTQIEPRTVDTQVRRLRDKLESAGAQLETVRGIGYRLVGTPTK